MCNSWVHRYGTHSITQYLRLNWGGTYINFCAELEPLATHSRSQSCVNCLSAMDVYWAMSSSCCSLFWALWTSPIYSTLSSVRTRFPYDGWVSLSPNRLTTNEGTSNIGTGKAEKSYVFAVARDVTSALCCSTSVCKPCTSRLCHSEAA